MDCTVERHGRIGIYRDRAALGHRACAEGNAAAAALDQYLPAGIGLDGHRAVQRDGAGLPAWGTGRGVPTGPHVHDVARGTRALDTQQNPAGTAGGGDVFAGGKFDRGRAQRIVDTADHDTAVGSGSAVQGNHAADLDVDRAAAGLAADVGTGTSGVAGAAGHVQVARDVERLVAAVAGAEAGTAVTGGVAAAVDGDAAGVHRLRPGGIGGAQGNVGVVCKTRRATAGAAVEDDIGARGVDGLHAGRAE